jgi:hypothetical protein
MVNDAREQFFLSRWKQRDIGKKSGAKYKKQIILYQ